MANDTDFLMLYRELGVGPECTPDELRKAYRRRVAKIHPDRRPAPTDGISELQQLNVLFDAAMQFERQHGRLPGTVRIVSPRARRPFRPAPAEPVMPRRRYALVPLVVIAVGAGTAYWDGYDSTADIRPQPSSIGHDSARTTLPTRTPRVQLGMNVEEVRAIEGDPMTGGDGIWEFGPSWIAFECGAVSDWYSSPLHPLNVGARRPVRHDAVDAPTSCRRSPPSPPPARSDGPAGASMEGSTHATRSVTRAVSAVSAPLGDTVKFNAYRAADRLGPAGKLLRKPDDVAS